MRFEAVRERVAALPRELPAPPAVLTPFRIDAHELFPDPTGFRRGRPAGVLVLLYPDESGVARVLLTARVPHGIQHAGEVSFPGGHAEPDDADPVATALREAAEEVALEPEQCGVRVVGALERVHIPVSGFRITPVVALAERRPVTRPAPDEVARILEAPVEAFLPDAPVELEERVIRERLVRFGVYPVSGERVWGATARILGQLGAVLAEIPVAVPAPLPVPLPGEPPRVRRAGPDDAHDIDSFLEALAPELAHDFPAAADVFVAERDGALVGIASWADWERPRDVSEPRGFDGLDLDAFARPAELTLLAVLPRLRGLGIGRALAGAVADAARSAGCGRLVAWTLADSAIHPSSIAARTFFRSNGFTDLAIDRRVLARGEDRLLLSREL